MNEKSKVMSHEKGICVYQDSFIEFESSETLHKALLYTGPFSDSNIYFITERGC